MRHPLFSGAWYPDSRSDCTEMLADFEEELLSLGKPVERGRRRDACAVIAPHAGWRFSGMTAWSAMADAASDDRELVVIFGGHLGERSAPILHRTDAWRTPFRDVTADAEVLDELEKLGGFELETDRRFRRDNGVELVLAMAAAAWPRAAVIAIGAPASVAAIRLGESVGNLFAPSGPFATRRVLFLASTDLTHYGPNYGFTPRGTGQGALEWVEKDNDADLIRRLATLDAEGVVAGAARRANACCPGAVAGVIAAVKRARPDTKLSFELADYRTSHYRVGGVPEDFVGYAAGVILGS